MTKLTIESEDFYDLAQCYRHMPIIERSKVVDAYNEMLSHIGAKLIEAYEQGKKDADIKEVVIGGDGFFAGCKVYIDPSLPPDTIEMRDGKKVIRTLLPKEPTCGK